MSEALFPASSDQQDRIYAMVPTSRCELIKRKGLYGMVNAMDG